MPLHDHAFLYVQCDVPDGVTLEGWRSSRSPAPRRRRLDGLMRLGRGPQGARRGREHALVPVVPADAAAG
jgi:hypothetical protein